MKKIIFTISFYFYCGLLFSQWSGLHYSASVNFDSNNNYLIQIDSLQSNNIWQICSPNKINFDSSYSGYKAIITDSINSYPINNFSSFTIKILPQYSVCWGTGHLWFVHKYDTDSKKDGGIVEIKYDNDTNWVNIIHDSDPIVFNLNNFYSDTDTIIDNIPSFTGNSNGWIESEFDWMWQIGVKSYWHDSLTIRFSFKSDSINTNKGGWMIDNIAVDLWDCTGKIDKNIKNQNVISLPNLTKLNSIIQLDINQFPYDLFIYDITGKNVKTYKDQVIQQVYFSQYDYSEGIYFYRLVKDKQILSNGKIILFH